MPPPSTSLEAAAASGYDVTMLIHSVYFWFRRDSDPGVVARFEDGLQRLATIPDIKIAYFGKPDSTPKRPAIDDSYDWALVEIFDDHAAHDRYQSHATHQQFLQDFSSSWEKVVVYDVRAQMPEGTGAEHGTGIAATTLTEE